MSLATIPTVPQVPIAPTGPVTLRDELDLWKEAHDFAKAIASTPFVPKALQNNPAAVMAAIIRAHELGVSALHGLSQIHVIDGRPCLAAELQRALILSHGHELFTEDLTITKVTLCGKRHDGDHVQRVTWTMDDAKRANLAGKPNWRTYPRAMLLARCTGELGRLMFADVLAGLGVNAEELTDGALDVLQLEPGVEAPPPAAALPGTAPRTRRTRKSAVATRPATAPAGPSAHPPEPGGPPPPLPGEDGYDETAPQGPADDRPHQAPAEAVRISAERTAAPDPVPPETTDEAPQPVDRAGTPEATAERAALETAARAEVITKRAQAIAMRARDVGVDHHHVVLAVTNGAKSSARDLNAAEADAVLHALVDMGAGRAELFGSEDETGTVWHLVDTSDAPEETKAERYQARIRDSKSRRPN
jgi:hypothetical protein